MMLSEAQWKAIQNVVEYLAADEQRHYEECDCPADHIWLSVSELWDMLEAAGRTSPAEAATV